MLSGILDRSAVTDNLAHSRRHNGSLGLSGSLGELDGVELDGLVLSDDLVDGDDLASLVLHGGEGHGGTLGGRGIALGDYLNIIQSRILGSLALGQLGLTDGEARIAGGVQEALGLVDHDGIGGASGDGDDIEAAVLSAHIDVIAVGVAVRCQGDLQGLPNGNLEGKAIAVGKRIALLLKAHGLNGLIVKL